jgi:hypothetical protein
MSGPRSCGATSQQRAPAPYFFKWPVRICCICHPEGGVGTYSPRGRGQWPFNIPWPLCSLWALVGGGRLAHVPCGAPNTGPPKSVIGMCLELGLAHDPGPQLISYFLGNSYGWIPHNAGFGFLDLAPSILHSNWFRDYIS